MHGAGGVHDPGPGVRPSVQHRRPNFYAVLDSHMQAIAASHLTARDVVLYFSYSGSTEELLKT